MQKQDLVFFIAAIAIVILLAVVVKPIMNGETVAILPQSSETRDVSNIPIPSGAPSAPYTPIIASSQAGSAEPSSSAWDGVAKSVQFVDPSTYNIQFASSKDFGFRMPGDEQYQKEEFVTYATIDGQWDATTQIIRIPFPYWDMKVSIESMGRVGNEDEDDDVYYNVAGPEQLMEEYQSGRITLQEYQERYKLYLAHKDDSEPDKDGTEGFFKSKGEGLGVEVENQQLIIPSINIQVMDADKPNGIVYILNSRTEGVIPVNPPVDEEDPDEKYNDKPEDVLVGEKKDDDKDIPVPRRNNLNEYYWQHRFYEGEGNYYFIINPNMLKSYKIEILVSTKFLDSSAAAAATTA
ncbi:MAG: hypothetical protein J6X83_03015 [Methanomicrobium sp.]|nr:hypothetical protein [Methanomicrobium sp.]